MDRLEYFISTISYTLDTKEKRHVVGGILMSASFLFIGLAITVVTIKTEDFNDE